MNIIAYGCIVVVRVLRCVMRDFMQFLRKIVIRCFNDWFSLKDLIYMQCWMIKSSYWNISNLTLLEIPERV